MNFKKIDIELPKLEQVNLPEGRRYVNSEGIAYPSVTTVLSSTQDHSFIEEWKKVVGEEEARRVSHHATTQGTIVHDEVERYILNRKGKSVMPQQAFLYNRLKRTIDEHLSTVYVTEAMLMSNHLRTAGTVDCVGVWDGVLSIIDWKTSKTVKTRDEIHSYFMQESFYAVAFEENTRLPVPNLVTVMACETGEVLVFKEKRDDWIDKFIKVRDDYEKTID